MIYLQTNFHSLVLSELGFDSDNIFAGRVVKVYLDNRINWWNAKFHEFESR